MLSNFVVTAYLVALSGALSTVLASINVSSNNDNYAITLDGKTIDIDKAVVLEEDKNFVVLSPVEVNGATIRMDKVNKSFAVDYKGSHFETMGSKQAAVYSQRINEELSSNLANMQANLNRAFGGNFPF